MRAQDSLMTAQYLVLAVLTLLSTVPSTFFSARELRNPHPETVRVARYLTVRSGALSLAAVVALVFVSPGWLLALAVIMALVQAADAVLAVLGRLKPVMVLGPIVAAVALVAAIAWLLSNGAQL